MLSLMRKSLQSSKTVSDLTVTSNCPTSPWLLGNQEIFVFVNADFFLNQLYTLFDRIVHLTKRKYQIFKRLKHLLWIINNTLHLCKWVIPLSLLKQSKNWKLPQCYLLHKLIRGHLKSQSLLLQSNSKGVNCSAISNNNDCELQNRKLKASCWDRSWQTFDPTPEANTTLTHLIIAFA